MSDFTLTGFAAFMTGMIAHIDRSKHEALEKAAVIVEDEAKRVIGTYEYGWPPLAASTLAKKAADTPLLETGKLRDSISHTVSGSEARVGTNEDVGLFQELGTSKIPPRPYLQGAVQHKIDEIKKAVGQTVMAKLIR